MGPDDEIEDEDEVLDDQELEQSNVVDSETEKDPKAVKGETARESIRRALQQHQETDENEEETDQEKQRKSNARGRSAVKSAEADNEIAEIGDEAEEVLEENKNEQEKKANVPPPGWTKAAKNVWNSLPPEVIESVAKREQEVSDGFKEYGEKVKKYEGMEREYNDINRSFQGREPELQRLGVSKAQVVNQMFQWIDALSHSDKNYAKSQLIQLGKNYGIDLSSTNTETKKEEFKEASNLPPELKEFASTLDTKFKGIESKLQENENIRIQRERQNQQDAANQFVNNWAKDKPHFQTVRQAMFGLLQSGSIPLKDGQLDLDEAYNQAVYANPTTREAVRKAEAEAEAKKASDEKKDKELKNLRKVNKAKTASSSISQRAPTGTTLKAGERKDGKAPSVRDSIKKSLAELRDQQ